MINLRTVPSPLGGEGKGEGRHPAWGTLTPAFSLEGSGS